ncbi:hypothetical protein GCM10008110_09790 [Marinobacter persicus]|nr:hypothetical protein GCM10008110_09790 [Marinobacter persicus]
MLYFKGESWWHGRPGVTGWPTQTVESRKGDEVVLAYEICPATDTSLHCLDRYAVNGRRGYGAAGNLAD